MIEPCVRLPWDSEFFGIRIARVSLPSLADGGAAQVDEWLANQSVDCCYFLARADEEESIRLAEERGFRLVDTRVTLGRDLSDIRPSLSTQTVRRYVQADVDGLAGIARVSHTDSRFYQDPGFPNDRCDDLYETWIRKSCAGFADAVLVGVHGGTPVGYVSCHGREVGEIGLLAVSAKAQGKGVGASLIEASLSWFKSNGFDRATVVTQARNIRASSLYERCGFVTESVAHWYHLWPAERSPVEDRGH